MPRPITAAALVLALLLAVPLAADTLLTKKRDADDFVALKGTISQGAKNQKVEIWIGSDRVRRDDGKNAVILRLDQRKLYLINHSEKIYAVVTVPPGLSLSKAGQDEMQRTWNLSAQAEPTGQTRKIGPWRASRYKIALSNQVGTGQRIELDCWMAPDLKIEDSSLRTLMRLLASARHEGDEWLEAILDLPGHPVLFERKEKQPEVDVKTREELVSVKESAPPAGIYEPPSDYQLQDFGEYTSLYGLPDPL